MQDYIDYNGETYPVLSLYGGAEKYTHDDLFYQWEKIIKVNNIKNINVILDQAGFCDILLWILKDENLYRHISSENEISALSIMQGKPYNAKAFRDVRKSQMRCYLLKKFSQGNWLLTKSKKKTNVSNCTIDDSRLSPLVETLAVDIEKINKIFNKNMNKEVSVLFEKLGIAQDFTKLSKEKMYEILLKIPNQSNIDKSVCRSIYNQFNLAFNASIIENDITRNNEEYDKFKNDGQVLCYFNGNYHYKPANAVYYANNKVYSDEILGKYPILALNRRQGEQKICKAFCVKSIREIGEINVFPVLHKLNDVFQKEYKLLLPYIYAKRIGKDHQEKELRELRKSNVILVTSAVTEYFIDELPVRGILKDYELIQAKGVDIAYIKIPEHIDSIETLKKELRFCETVSELFTVFLNVESDKSFFSQLIGASKSDRDYLYKSDGDIYLTTLNAAKEKFITDINYMDEFWNAVATAIGQKITEFDKKKHMHILTKDFDYKELGKNEQPKNIIALFIKLGIDIVDYNQTALQPVYLQEYYKIIYENLKRSYMESQQAYSHECWKLDIPVFENSVNINVYEVFNKQIEELIAKQQQQQNQTEHSSRTNATNGENDAAASEKENIENIKKEAEERGVLDIRAVDIEKAEPNKDWDRSSTGKRQRQGIFDSKEKKLIGFIGELEVFRSLKQMKLNDQIKAFEWISGNAVKNSTTHIENANDSAGYDFEVSFDGFSKTYIEVKSSSQNGIIFDITKNEINFAKKHRERYNVYFVSIKGKTPMNIQDLGCIFNFKENEDFFSNTSFMVEEKSFTVKAKLKCE